MADAEWLASEWMARFADVMHAMTDAKPRMQLTGIGELPQAELVWWKQMFSCSTQYPFWLGTLEQNGAAIGHSVLSSAGVESPPAPEVRSTWLEILRQSMSGLAEGIGGRISGSGNMWRRNRSPFPRFGRPNLRSGGRSRRLTPNYFLCGNQ